MITPKITQAQFEERLAKLISDEEACVLCHAPAPSPTPEQLDDEGDAICKDCLKEIQEAAENP